MPDCLTAVHAGFEQIERGFFLSAIKFFSWDNGG